MKRLEMHNGDVEDEASICHNCQQPDPDRQAADGEWYHYDCVPESLR